MAELRFQLSGVRVLQIESNHLDLLFGTVARYVCLVPYLRVVCHIDYAQLAPDDLALWVYKPLQSHLRTRHVRRAVTVRCPRRLHARTRCTKVGMRVRAGRECEFRQAP